MNRYTACWGRDTPSAGKTITINVVAYADSIEEAEVMFNLCLESGISLKESSDNDEEELPL